jgi:pyruvate carboxylase subunit B
LDLEKAVVKKVIQVMDTSFRDGFQSVYGARVLSDDFMPAIQATLDAGITHLEAGGGARFQSLFFYCNESAFDMMDRFRETVGPDIKLQTLARGINVVALNQQPRDIIDLHAKMFKKHGMTTIRNFDALNDVRNLKYSGERITHHGLNHEIVIAIMDLPPGCEGAHTAEFYTNRLQQILDAEIPFSSICFKDASGTANPRKVYETIKAARKLLPADTHIRLHTHDTAGTGVSQYLAAIEAGVDGIDLAKTPVSGGTSQPDFLTMWHALKGTDYTLDLDYEKILTASEVFQDCMKEYFIPPEAQKTSPIIPLSPMPGGALTANTMMMRDTNTLHLFPKVIKEMSEVVRKGGFGTSVTPVSQFYFQQAYANVMMGRWKKITPSYGDMVLGYFGETPVPADPEIIKLASEQLGKPPFTGDPIGKMSPGIPKATKILEDNNLPVTEENIFIIASCENKGLDFLQGKGKVSVRKNQEEKKAGENSRPIITDDLRHNMIEIEGKAYNVSITIGTGEVQLVSPAAKLPFNKRQFESTELLVPTPGEVVAVLVKEGDTVELDQTVMLLETMKMETEIKAHKAGKIGKLHVHKGDSVQASEPVMTIN